MCNLGWYYDGITGQLQSLKHLVEKLFKNFWGINIRLSCRVSLTFSGKIQKDPKMWLWTELHPTKNLLHSKGKNPQNDKATCWKKEDILPSDIK